MVKAKILNPDQIEVEVSIKHSVYTWKLIRDALERGMKGDNWHAQVSDFKTEIANIVAAIEKTIEPEASNEASK